MRGDNFIITLKRFEITWCHNSNPWWTKYLCNLTNSVVSFFYCLVPRLYVILICSILIGSINTPVFFCKMRSTYKRSCLVLVLASNNQQQPLTKICRRPHSKKRIRTSAQIYHMTGICKILFSSSLSFSLMGTRFVAHLYPVSLVVLVKREKHMFVLHFFIFHRFRGFDHHPTKLELNKSSKCCYHLTDPVVLFHHQWPNVVKSCPVRYLTILYILYVNK